MEWSSAVSVFNFWSDLWMYNFTQGHLTSKSIKPNDLKICPANKTQNHRDFPTMN